MRNKLVDLNNHLFAQLERLSDEELKGDALTEEINRAKAVTGIASQIIANGNLVLNAVRIKEEFFRGKTALPEFFGDTAQEQEKKKIPESLKAELGRS